MSKKKLALIGYGQLGSILFSSWQRRYEKLYDFTIIHSYNPDLKNINVKFISADSDDFIDADIVVICLKPQKMIEALPQYAHRIAKRALIISTVAGKTLGFYKKYLSQHSVIRVMPNTFAENHNSFTGLCANSSTLPAQKREAEELFEELGKILWLSDESQMASLTALTGSGPAYLYFWAESFKDVAQTYGYSDDIATEMVRTLFSGAAHNINKTKNWDLLRAQVTSKGGTTEAACKILENPELGLKQLIMKAVAQATLRSKELSESENEDFL